MGMPDKCFSTDPSKAIEQLRERVKNKQTRSKSYTDEKRGAKEPNFAVGDYVRVTLSAIPGKLSSQFSAPKKIVEKRGPASYLLEDLRVWNASKLAAVHPAAVSKMRSGTSAVMNWSPASTQSSGTVMGDLSHPGTSRVDHHENADSPEPLAADSAQVSPNLSGSQARIRRSTRKKKTPQKFKDYIR